MTRDERLSATVRGELPGMPLVVAVSGGVDSMVLLHLLRFGCGLDPARLRVAHFDHAMRPCSPSDADWVRGVCRAWCVACHTAAAPAPPTSEDEARRLRYRFLQRVRQEVGAGWIATAHHMDDQAETVLFRALRGTGVDGLAAMPSRSSNHVWRPLLGHHQRELTEYAASVGLRWREDPTNRGIGARSVMRHVLLPEAARVVANDPVEALAGLARRAALDEGAWTSLYSRLLEDTDARWDDAGVSLSRDALLAAHAGVRTRLIRYVAKELGHPLTASGTAAAVQFTTGAASGRALDLTAGLRVRRDFERIGFRVGGVDRTNAPLRIEHSQGRGFVVVGGRRYHVRWGHGPGAMNGEACFAQDVAFPLEVRGWQPGDRIRLPVGSKKLKELFREARVPAPDRHRTPVVVDGTGSLLWVPGVAQSVDSVAMSGAVGLHMGIARADID